MAANSRILILMAQMMLIPKANKGRNSHTAILLILVQHVRTSQHKAIQAVHLILAASIQPTLTSWHPERRKIDKGSFYLWESPNWTSYHRSRASSGPSLYVWIRRCTGPAPRPPAYRAIAWTKSLSACERRGISVRAPKYSFVDLETAPQSRSRSSWTLYTSAVWRPWRCLWSKARMLD